jgi:hypothetical protein
MKNYNNDERHNYWRRHLIDLDQFEELKKEYREEDRKKLKFELFKIFLRNNHEIELKYNPQEIYPLTKIIDDSIEESKKAYDRFFEEMDK